MDASSNLFYDFVNLNIAVNEDQYGLGNKLLHYLARPRMSVNNFCFRECCRYMEKRMSFEKLPTALGFAPQDASVFKVRFNFLAGNERAYALAVKPNPTVEELAEFGLKRPCWSILYAVKNYLWQHPDEAKAYRGLLPLGSEVTRFLNTVDQWSYGSGSNTADHVRLMNLSNQIADALNLPSVTVNDLMYLRGRSLKNS